ncbi:DMT family transporter [Mesorhizobium carmichaelinearum]|uniref:DMT family transporter n=1 Tax=Mesorhizobium carmichaelinearum TaxID=1208188 RepID=UPI001FCE8039|nr:SMR family transporter [Mesorhizobium carmichaelinearum]
MQQFTKAGPTAAAISSLIVALFFLSHALKEIPLGATYAIWCGVGMGRDGPSGIGERPRLSGAA